MSQAAVARSVRSLLDEARRRLAEAGVETPGLDAQVLLAASMGCSRAALFARARDTVPAAAEEVFLRFLERRAAREPVARILGRKEFYGLCFAVTPDVLVPRPETELLVSLAFERLRAMKGPVRVLDVGSGSGCVSVSLARLALDHGLHISVTAVDSSAGALNVTQRNAEAHGVASCIRCEVADALDPAWSPQEAPFQMLVSNPPYVASQEIDRLQPEVCLWDPREALDGGSDGLDFISGLLRRIPGLVAEGGVVLLEVGAGQAAAVGEMAAAAGLQFLTTHTDLAGIPRVVELCRP
ncbi:MAG: release factor glutamine methyltransferase [Armatimonadota bacterium]|nr:MAG: release factor glutamine methyltransferase [Armatimonadota bacterium]